MAGEKTEKATPKRRKDERKKGNVPQSKDIVTVASMLILFTLLKIIFPYMYATMEKFFHFMINKAGAAEEISSSTSPEIIAEIIKLLTVSIMPLMIFAMAVTVIGTGAQTKFLFSAESLKPKLSKFNPINGIKRIVSIRSSVELVKNLIKLSIIGVILYKFLMSRVDETAKMLFVDLIPSSTYALDSVVDMVYMVGIIFIFVAGLDYLYQVWEYERKIRMSKQEIKEEFKQMEGDPQIKGKIKQKQKQMAMSRMMQNVPTADVVIRNPNHFAVALRYDTEKDSAPVIVAKGQDSLALRIVAVAEQSGVYIIEDRPLARGIYAIAEVGMEIPYAYYTAVAEVFALVYSVQKKDINGNRKKN